MLLAHTLFLLTLAFTTHAKIQSPLLNSVEPYGSSGVAAMMMQSGSLALPAEAYNLFLLHRVVSDQHVIFLDRIEKNPLLDPQKNPYWAAEFSLDTKKVRGLKLTTNSFCASGALSSDGSFVSIGGSYQSNYAGVSGLQSVRRFIPCSDATCQFTEKEALLKKRWYPGTVKLQDGSILIAGGLDDTRAPVYQNNFEFLPSKSTSVVPSLFLKDAFEYPLFPNMHLLPSGQILVLANRLAMLYDWKLNKETRLPQLAMTVTYPFSGASALLPLKKANRYLPTVLVCGGAKVVKNAIITIDWPASDQCARLDLDTKGIKIGWQYERIPFGGVIMANLILLPTGQLVLVNGAGSGYAGYLSKLSPLGTGFSAAKIPRMTPYLYDPSKPAGKRFSSMGVQLKVPRLYHSTASLLPSGSVLISGSNANPGVQLNVPFATSYQNELLSPSYVKAERTAISRQPARVHYGALFTLRVSIPSSLGAAARRGDIQVSIHDFGFSTHGVQYQQRMMVLEARMQSSQLTIFGPTNPSLFPPGPCWIFVTIGGVPSKGTKIMLGE